MPNFIDRLFRREPKRGKAAIASLRPSWQSLQPEYAIGVGYETIVKEGYRKNELIFGCINRTANTGAQISLSLKTPDGKKIDKHPILDLLHKPNPILSEAEFWAAVIIMQKLAGRAVFEIEYTNGMQPVALWPLRPDRLEIVPDVKRPVPAEYIYKIPGMPDQHLRPEQVLDFPLYDPLDQFTSYPPVAVAARVGDVDNSATDFIKLVWEHGGVPMGVLKTTQVLTDIDVEDIRRRWRERYGGYENWIDPAILDRDAEYQRTGLTFTELGFEMLDARNEARICMVLDVPPIIVGAKIGLDKATYSNYETALRAWWQNSIIPMYETFRDTLNSQLVPLYTIPQGATLQWDTSRVPALRENEDNLWKRVTAAFQAGLLTMAQAMELLNMDVPAGTTGEYYLRPSSVTMVPLSEADEKPEPPPALAPGKPGQEGEPKKPMGEDMPDEEDMPMDNGKFEAVLFELKRANDLLEARIEQPHDQPTT